MKIISTKSIAILLILFLIPHIIYASGKFTVQAGAFSSRKNAQNVITILRSHGIQCAIYEQKGLSKVHCGDFSKKSEANVLSKKVSSVGYDAFVVPKIIQSPQDTPKTNTPVEQPKKAVVVKQPTEQPADAPPSEEPETEQTISPPVTVPPDIIQSKQEKTGTKKEDQEQEAIPALRAHIAGYGVAVSAAVIPVGGMSCASCAAKIEKTVLALPGVLSAAVNLATGEARVEYLDTVTGLAQIKKEIVSAGYEVPDEPAGPEAWADDTSPADREYLILRRKVAAGGILAFLVFLGSMRHWFPWAPAFLQDFFVLWALATPVQFVLGLQFYRGAWNALRHGAANMNTLIAVGASAAYLFSVAATVAPGLMASAGVEPQVYFDTSAVIIVLILFGRMLEARAKGRTSDAIRRLMGLRPRTARVLGPDGERDVPIGEVRVGDVLVVRPGEQVGRRDHPGRAVVARRGHDHGREHARGQGAGRRRHGSDPEQVGQLPFSRRQGRRPVSPRPTSPPRSNRRRPVRSSSSRWRGGSPALPS